MTTITESIQDKLPRQLKKLLVSNWMDFHYFPNVLLALSKIAHQFYQFGSQKTCSLKCLRCAAQIKAQKSWFQTTEKEREMKMAFNFEAIKTNVISIFYSVLRSLIVLISTTTSSSEKKSNNFLSLAGWLTDWLLEQKNILNT